MLIRSSGTELTLGKLLDEVSSSAYAVRRGVHPQLVHKIWIALCSFIHGALSKNKGVLIPSLGTFSVLSTSSRPPKHVPVFELLDRRFSAVSQEISHVNRLLKRSGVLSINYQTLSLDTCLHRSCCQKVIKSIADRLAAHILSGSNLKVVFPTVGVLSKNKAGRIQFKFEGDLVDQMEPRRKLPRPDSTKPGRDLSQGRYLSPPAVSPLNKTRAEIVQTPLKHERGPSVNPPFLSDTRLRICHELDSIWTLCKDADRHPTLKAYIPLFRPRNSVGRVKKSDFESWIQLHCRTLLKLIDALVYLDLIHTYTADSRKEHVFYAQLLSSFKDLSLKADLQTEEIREDTPQILQINPDVDTQSESSEESCEENKGDYNGQSRLRSRKDCDDFNQLHFRRLVQSRGGEVAPKVSEDPRTVDEANFATLSPHIRAQTAPPLQIDSPKSSAAAIRDAWRRQLEEKAKLIEEFRNAEERWPYIPIHQPHMRLPATAPRYVSAHYVRPYDQPTGLSWASAWIRS